MSPLPRLRALAIAIASLLVIGIGVATAAPDEEQGRDPWYRPFKSTSIWNMPIGSNARYVDSGYPVYTKGAADESIIARASASDQQLDMRATHHWRDRCNESSTRTVGRLYVPNNLYVSDATQNSNGGWRTPNNNGAILQPDGRTIANVSVVCRDRTGGPIYGYMHEMTDLYGDGIVGSTGGSKLSAIGGAIRPGELTNDKPIQHALDLILFSKHAYINGSDRSTCYRWPALRCDAYAGQKADRYAGNNPEFKMGALFAIPPHLKPEDLGITTKAGRKLFAALQDYGGYWTDDSAWEANYLKVDVNAHSDIAAFHSGNVRSEFGRMLSAAKIIANNGPDSIGGGGTPRRPLLPEISPDGKRPTTTTTAAPTTTTTAAPTTTTTTTTTAPTTTVAPVTTVAPPTTAPSAPKAPAPAAPTAPAEPDQAESVGWTTLYRNDFGTDSGPMGAEFQLEGAPFRRIAGEAGAPSGAGESIATVNVRHSDVVVASRIKLSNERASAGVSLRADSRNRQILVSANRSDRRDEISLYTINGGYQRLASADRVGLKPGGVHDLRVEASGRRISVLLDGRLVLTHQLTAAQYRTYGGTSHGLRTYLSGRADDGKSRWQDLQILTTRAAVADQSLAKDDVAPSTPEAPERPDTPKATAQAPVRFSDSFDGSRAKSEWRYDWGTQFSARNQAFQARKGAGEGIAVVDLRTPDVDISATIGLSRYRSSTGLAIRAADRKNMLAVGFSRDWRQDEIGLYLVDNGTYRRLAIIEDAGLRRGGSHDVRVVASGPTVTVWVDGTVRLTHQLDGSAMKSLAGNTSHGVRSYRSGRGEDGRSTWDDIVMR